jgi:hypothetical protein
MGDEVIINEEAYAFRPILRITPDGPHFTVSLLSNELGTQFTSIHEENTHLLFSIWSEKSEEILDHEACLQQLLSNVEREIGSYEVLESELISLPIGIAMRNKITGTNNNHLSNGEIVSILTEQGCLNFVAQTIEINEEDKLIWSHLGKPAFDKMVQSLRFLTPEEMAFCKTAPRDTYGFSPEDPIAVGNSNLYDGREREELYLLTLRGPDGEEIIFQRQSPIFNQNGEIVDPYQIQYGSSPTTTLYFTIYRYQEPLYLPIGYSCEAAFPLSDPKP